MKIPDIDKEKFQSNPTLFSEPVVRFNQGQSEAEGNKNKLKGLLANGPFDVNSDIRDFDRIRIIPAVRDDDQTIDALEDVLINLKQSLWEDKKNDRQLGFQDIFNCEVEFAEKDQWYRIPNSKRDSYEKIGKTIRNNYDFKDGDTRNIVIFVTQSSSSSKSSIANSEYHGMKKSLLEGFLPSQCLSEKWNGVIGEAKNDRISRYTLINVACQMYAKVGGIPWVLSQPEDRYTELNIGLRASVPKTSEENYAYGIAQLFSRNGLWVNSIVKEGTSPLTSESYDLSADAVYDLLERSKKKYESSVLEGLPYDNISRISVHKLKGFSDSEIAGAKQFADDNDVKLNLTGIQESNIRIYQGSWEDTENTRRGFYQSINSNHGVLCTTGDYLQGSRWRDHRLGTPVPITIKTYDEDGLHTPEVKEEAKRIFYLTRINWDDAINSEISKPVTINYAGRVAKKVASGIDISKINEDVPWFL